MSGHSGYRDPWADRLSEYMDGELSVRERRACEEHVARCPACAAILAELRRVVARAGQMNAPIEPVRDLWPGIARRLETRAEEAAPSRIRRIGWLRPQIAGAALLVIACLVIATWLLHPAPEREGRPLATQQPPSSSTAAPREAEREYETTVANLQREAHARLTLDPRLVEVLDENLATLDLAIASYRDALRDDPGDQDLRSRLDAARQKKIEVLQQAVTLASEGTE